MISDKMPKIAVIGDAILDKYIYGDVSRISPEAPIPVVLVTNIEYKPGGAGNVAANLARLGADADLFSIVGDDYNKEILRRSLQEFNVNSQLITDKDRPTIVKERYIASSQQLLRVDYELEDHLKSHHIDEIKTKFSRYDSIIISDYAKGMMSQDIMSFLKTQNIPIFVDPKPKNALLYSDVFFILPNVKECTSISHVEDDLDAAKKLRDDLNSNILLTRGSKGMALIKKNDDSIHLLETVAREVTDVTGAGDTVIATFAFFYSKGYPVTESAELANKAAGIAVGKMGCYQVSLDELLND